MRLQAWYASIASLLVALPSLSLGLLEGDKSVAASNATELPRRVFGVYRLQPKDDRAKLAIEQLYDNASQLKLDFWKTPHEGGGFWDVMMEARTAEVILPFLDRIKVPVTRTIEDVERLIIAKEKKPATRFFSWLHDDSSSSYDFRRYGSYSSMQRWLRNLARDFPHLVQLTSIGTTHEGRSIDGIEIGLNRETSKVFWIDAGMHAREWAAPHTALYFIHQLTSRSQEPEIRKFLESITFVIIPVANPDGYEFTRSSTNPHVRMWRKNRSEMICRKDDWGRRRCCRGVDLNRNFDFHFRESGSSDDPCSEIYQGKAAFSEPESRAVRDGILSRRYSNRLTGYITLHTYSQIWIHSYGHRRDAYPSDVDDLYRVAKKATKALEKMYGTKYIVGSGADTLYPASGGSEDWVKMTAKVKYVYLIELRPEERNWNGFILDESELLPTARETWEGVKVVAEAILEKDAFDRGLARQADGTAQNCVDQKQSCARWLRERPQLCTQVPLFMKENCARSCDIC